MIICWQSGDSAAMKAQMKAFVRYLLLAVVGFLASGAIKSPLLAQSNTARLSLEQATDGLGSWQRVPITPAMLNEGSIDIAALPSGAFYRLKIAVLAPSATVVTVQGGVLPASSGLAGSVVKTFKIGKYEVIWSEWKEVRDWAVNNGYSDLAGVGNRSGDNHPVRSVSWYDVVKWCNARSEKEGLKAVYRINGAVYRTGQSNAVPDNSAGGYRLPSEPEWEWAARGGIWSQDYIFSGSNDLNEVGWYYDNSIGAPLGDSGGRGTWPIGLKRPNELGIHDMNGNVLEWCFDIVGDNEAVRRFRGGSYGWTQEYCTVDNRYWFIGAINRNGDVGFRLARNAP